MAVHSVVPEGVAIGVNEECNLGSFELHSRNYLPQVRGNCYLKTVGN